MQNTNRLTVLSCWSCKGPIAHTDLFCATCQAVLPPGQVDYFTRFDLEQSYDVDLGKLELKYFDLQQRLHPDRFAQKTAKEKSISQQQALSLNDAFETLKDPLKRADYLLKLNGHMGINHDHTINDPVLLMEAMETREALAQAQDVATINVIVDNARRNVRQVVQNISLAFAENKIEEASKLALKLKYLNKLLEETRQYKARLVLKNE